jgi:NAD(P)-dependent dehydrogenase (short-subunit alcohol dehydrogenase family)
MIRFDNQVAIVTGAGNGLGRTYAKALAARGARVVVNDLGSSGESAVAALKVVEEIEADGGTALAYGANVADFAQVSEMVRQVVSKWGRIDILVNNAGALMPGTFLQSSLEHMAGAMDVNFWGTVYPCKAAWATMLAQNYGRIVVTTSSAGLYGSEGIIGYCAAKAALIGLINGLHAEGNSKGIRVNGIAPTAATNMNRALLPQKIIPLMQPEAVTPAVLYLVGPDAPSRTILSAGSGVFATTEIVEAAGEYLPLEARTPEMIAERYAAISDSHGAQSIQNSFAQSLKFVRKAAEQEQIDIS